MSTTPYTPTRAAVASAEATRDPIFLLQSRRVQLFPAGKWEWCPDHERFFDSDEHAECPGDDETLPMFEGYSSALLTAPEVFARDRESGFEEWTTVSVWLTREEAEACAGLTAYRYRDGWRVFCLCAEGELAEMLRRHHGAA